MSLQTQSMAPPPAFGVKFHKCAQVHQTSCVNMDHFIHLYYLVMKNHAVIHTLPSTQSCVL